MLGKQKAKKKMLVPWSGSEVVWKEEGRRSQQNTLAGALHRLNASATTLRFISLPPRGVLRRAKLVWLRLTAVKAAALRVNLNINGCSIVAPPARPSPTPSSLTFAHATRTLLRGGPTRPHRRGS